MISTLSIFSILFINACILVAFIGIRYILIKDKSITNTSPLFSKMIFGIANGVLAIILMLYGVHISDRMVDFRYTPMIVSAIYGGYVSTIITTIFICVFRILFTGVSYVSTVVVIFMIIMLIGITIICNLNLSRGRKWILSIIYLFVIYFIIGLFIAVDMNEHYKDIRIFYPGTIIVSFIVYVYEESLIKMVKAKKAVKIEAMKDFLTGLNNRRAFENIFNDRIASILKNKRKVSLLMIDIDFFKKINDTYGHSIGDLALKQLAKIILESVEDPDLASRNGGEEFSILLDCGSAKALQIAEKLREKVSDYIFKVEDDITLSITISIGVATYNETTQDINELLENADKALYKAKNTGRNKVILYERD